MNTVLVVDDKEMLRDSVGATLQRAGYEVLSAPDGPGALETIARRRPDAVVTDLRMPGMTGIELVQRARDIDDLLPIVVMTAYGAVDTAVDAIKAGAFDYITKPFEGDELIVAVKRAIDHARMARENAVFRTTAEGARPAASGQGPGPRGLERLVGESPAMRRVRQQVLAVAESHGTVLIFGESGTGKEVVARAVHELSPRAGEPFLAVNCAALSESLLESELFGHERGSFTGAERLRKGRFELADRGTLLLDEISEVSPKVQAKLLRVLQERAFERVGSSMTIGVDVRVVATSNRDLPRSVARGEFRQDLFFRLNVLPVHLPPLRDRLEDVPALVNHFLSLTAEREGKPARRMSDEAMSVLRAYAWPGNVREVQNVCERAAVLCKSEVIERTLIEPWLLTGEAVAVPTVEHKAQHGPLSAASAPEPGFIPFDGRQLEDIERDAIVRTLTKFNGHRQRTAQSLGIGVRTLGLKLKKWKQQQLVEQTL
ncbi:MAG: sigma-54-dependent Fis family transcriptional regulator [Phycisphaeraceae bacterium]|nr:sigma-54-dependent Fis family transcriptional regulator [Phycisphaeraceae bacterium]